MWGSINTQAEVKKGVIKARVLAGVYILQSNRHSFSGGVVEPTCQLCFLEDEDDKMSGILRYLGCYSGAAEADSAGTDGR